MKKILLSTMALAMFISVSSAQTAKPVTLPAKTLSKDSAFVKTVTMSVDDYSNLVQLGTGYKNSVIYDPKLQDSKALQQNIDMYLFQLGQRIKIDSIKVKIPPAQPK